MPRNSTTVMLAAVIPPMAMLKLPSASANATRPRTPSPERRTKRSSSRRSCPNTLTTRKAPSASWITPSATLSSRRTSRDRRRSRGRYTCAIRSSGGDGGDGEAPIEPEGHVDHSRKGDRRAHQRDEPVDHQGPDGGRVQLDAVHGIGGADRVVVRQGQPL